MNKLVEKIINPLNSPSGEAREVVYKAGGELYHWKMAVQENGKKPVLNKMIKKLEDKGVDVVEATKEAAIQFQTMERLEEGEFGFKEMREEFERSKGKAIPQHKSIRVPA